MNFSIAFIDTEIEPKSQKIFDISSIKGDGSSFHKTSLTEFIQFLKGTQFICGHNFFNHDLTSVKYLNDAGVETENAIDTLFLAPWARFVLLATLSVLDFDLQNAVYCGYRLER